MNRGPVLGLAMAILGNGSLSPSQEAVPGPDELRDIQHSPAPCLDTEAFPLILAEAATSDAARRAGRLTVRFKAEDDADWYEIAFQAPTGTLFQAALPKPLPEAGRIAYYIASDNADLRSPDYMVNVLMGGCPGARAAPPELTEGIRVRRTSDDQDEIPRGFSPDGIQAGGSMSATTIGILAGTAAGAGVTALVITGDEPISSSGDIENPEALRACFTPDSIPDIDSGETILFDASCTSPSTVTDYRWDFGDGTTGQGSSVEHLFTPGGIYTVTLTVSEGQRTDNTSRVVRVIATPSACFITTPDPPRIVANEAINFNAECSVGDRDGGSASITLYEWDFGDGRPGAEGVFVSRQFSEPDLYGVTLTVTNEDGRQDKTTQFVVVERRAPGNSTEATFTSQLEFPEETGVRAQLSLNDSATVETAPPSPERHRVRARAGENVVDGRLLSEASAPGRWRFDFGTTPNFVPGSIRVDSGQVLAMDSHSVVFRLSGKSGPFVRFRFRLVE